MPKCSICSHPHRRQIDRAIAHGQRIAERFQVSRSAICRHRRHITEAIVKARTVGSSEATSLVDQVQQVATDARRITKLAEKRGKLSIALGGLREVSRNLELIGRLSGELLSGGANVAVGIASLSAADQAILAEAHRRQAMTAEEREKYNAELLAEMARIEKEIARYANKPTKRLHAGCGNPIAVQP